MLLLYLAPSHLYGARSLRRFDRSISIDYQVGDRQIYASPSPLRPSKWYLVQRADQPSTNSLHEPFSNRFSVVLVQSISIAGETCWGNRFILYCTMHLSAHLSARVVSQCTMHLSTMGILLLVANKAGASRIRTYNSEMILLKLITVNCL